MDFINSTYFDEEEQETGRLSVTAPALYSTTIKNMKALIISLLLTSILFTNTLVFGSFRAKTNNKIIALDLKTGNLIWEYNPSKLSDAHFEVYNVGLIVYPHYNGANKSNPIFLNPNTGKTTNQFKTISSNCLAKSATFWPTHNKKLSNDWVLTNFSPGNSKELKFVDPKRKKLVWEIKTEGYPYQVKLWNNYVFYAYSYLSKEGILYAYKAKKKMPTWTIDLNSIIKDSKEPLTRMIFQIINDILYLEANEHIFAFAPKSGKLLWHRNLAKNLKLGFQGSFFGGGLNLAVFTKSDDILVISFEKRVVALNLKTMKYLWHLEPDTFPHCPFPVAYSGKLFLSSGKNRKLHIIKTE